MSVFGVSRNKTWSVLFLETWAEILSQAFSVVAKDKRERQTDRSTYCHMDGDKESERERGVGACVHERSTKVVKGRQERDRDRQRKIGRESESTHTHTHTSYCDTHARIHTLKNPQTDKIGCALLLPYRRGSLQLSDHRNVGIFSPDTRAQSTTRTQKPSFT